MCIVTFHSSHERLCHLIADSERRDAWQFRGVLKNPVDTLYRGESRSQGVAFIIQQCSHHDPCLRQPPAGWVGATLPHGSVVDRIWINQCSFCTALFGVLDLKGEMRRTFTGLVGEPREKGGYDLF